MAQVSCGFGNNGLLIMRGPTLQVDIGFDPKYRKGLTMVPTPGITGLDALVDTGATISCIDDFLATKLNLPIADKRNISGSSGKHTANMYLAQIRIPALNFVIYGMFAGVNLIAGGQSHHALIGRTFLQSFKMVYEGRTGTVVISN